MYICIFLVVFMYNHKIWLSKKKNEAKLRINRINYLLLEFISKTSKLDCLITVQLCLIYLKGSQEECMF